MDGTPNQVGLFMEPSEMLVEEDLASVAGPDSEVGREVGGREHRLRLSHPLHHLHSYRNQGGFDEIPVMHACLRILQALLEHTEGIDEPLTRDRLLDRVREHLTELDQASYPNDPDPERVDRLFDYCFTGLLNDAEQRTKFRGEYATTDEGGRLVKRFSPFRLILEVEDPKSDSVVLRPDSAAASLYLHTEDADAEDEQALLALRLQYQLSRGRWGKAEQMARTARTAARQYVLDIQQKLARVERMLDRTPWDEIEQLLERSRTHLLEFEQLYGSILAFVQQTLESETHAANLEVLRSLQRVEDIVRACADSLSSLAREIIEATGRFAHAHGERAIRARGRVEYPDFTNDLLNPMVSLAASRVDDDLVTDLEYLLFGPLPPSVLSVEMEMEHAVRETRTINTVGDTFERGETEELITYEDVFSDQDKNVVETVLEGVDVRQPFLLSELMSGLPAGASEKQEFLMLHSVTSQWFALDESAEPPLFDVEVLEGAWLRGRYYEYQDVRFSPRGTTR